MMEVGSSGFEMNEYQITNSCVRRQVWNVMKSLPTVLHSGY